MSNLSYKLKIRQGIKFFCCGCKEDKKTAVIVTDLQGKYKTSFCVSCFDKNERIITFMLISLLREDENGY